MFSVESWNELKTMVQQSHLREKLTEFQIIGDATSVGSVNEEEIPWAIVLNEVHGSETLKSGRQVEASMDWGLPVPVIFGLLFLLALVVFFSVD